MTTAEEYEHQLQTLLIQIRSCSLCQKDLPLPAKPILQASSHAKILIAGQAPGVKTHHKGIPFDDASGERLRNWLNISREQFYDPKLFAIIPMGFCFPGSIERNGKKQGDKPPRPECAATWHSQLLALMPNIELIIVLGQYAIDYHLSPLSTDELVDEKRQYLTHLANKQKLAKLTDAKALDAKILKRPKLTVTQTIAHWQDYWPNIIALPHPSPRNNLWLKQHPEFEVHILPMLKTRIHQLLNFK
ncbi:uracil-DNA glycosylase family protein [Shewanella acanthi]|uniref:uracil-DNA glycosylase family protein n=1 Tax=Shewanella acanthi TaxID=2864212 RepID=UPI001C655280|nr:uracil-DNA glycosylase family protein [Shewanella acanthi]QYJ77730.1 uracil-DNA glycosylase family protein [Shewanella acanthi]